jgi:hypothetical protein
MVRAHAGLGREITKHVIRLIVGSAHVTLLKGARAW